MSNPKANIDYLLPHNNEIRDLIPYRTNKQLEAKVEYLFSHAHFVHNKLFNDIRTSGSRTLVRDMSKVATGLMRYFMQYPQQYGDNIENIEWQILIRMWKQTFKHTRLQKVELSYYAGTKQMLLGIDNGWVDELQRTVDEEDYYATNDSMVKKREGVSLRGKRNNKKHNPASLIEGEKHFEYLCGLD